ncbi:Hydroxyacylglutathione_hydrolase [Hexamita inflata]|uniref:Hydroxyacylglutathione hydrolase n=1 Tax=Hexamita inflata TaxID=28002 RepID=A0AA86PIV1_9EUKA|nr:Hydroxyacylglutathione hydrolase [Hexamita inflata]CAI9961567.1 Hydroxyacylglutathione hydrolase [Hexamita inflata]
MQTKLFTGGQFCTNLYIVHNQYEAIIIDPGFADQEIDQFIEQQNLIIKYIILTHAHIDHYLFAGYYRVKYKAKIYCHEADKQQFKRSYSYAKKVVDQFPQNFMNSADIYFNCGQLQLCLNHVPFYVRFTLLFNMYVFNYIINQSIIIKFIIIQDDSIIFHIESKISLQK